MIKEIKVEELEEIRLDSYIAKTEELKLSRSMIQKLLDDNKITVNGRNEKASYKVKTNDIIRVQIDKPKEVEIKAEDIPLDVIYEDKDIIVVNKQKGIVVHPANGNWEGTLVNAIMAHCKDSLSGIGGELRPGIVHRLDKDTSGLLIIAKNDESHISLSQQIKDRLVNKTYIALVRGLVPENKATINMPIGRSQNDRKKMAVTKNGKEAITHINVLNRYVTDKGKYTLLEVKIDTGRTHQIRVHLSQIGYPVVGDMTYSNGKNEFNIEGQCLHAKKLEFSHPITGKKMILEAPLPEYFEKVLNYLERKLLWTEINSFG